MDCDFEDLPPVAQRRITALKSALERSRPVDKRPLIDAFLERVAKQFPAFDFAGNPADMDAWVTEQLRKDETWVMDMASILWEEGLETRKEALQAQLCSSIGKSLPEDFDFSQDEKGNAWAMAYDSALSQAETFNAQLPKWIAKARADWVKEHGSLQGLNRYGLLALTKKYIEHFDSWHNELVVITEFANQWANEVMAFWSINVGEAELEYYLAPQEASSPLVDTVPLCSLYAGRWLTHNEVSMFPAHPRCPHFCSATRIKNGSLPLFLGIGFSKYNREDLPPC